MASKGAEWVAGYVAAWESNDPEQIGALFTDDAVYLTAPDVEPRRGRDAIVAGWLEDLDEPGTWSFDWKILDERDGFVLVQGRTESPAEQAAPRESFPTLRPRQSRPALAGQIS